MRITCCPACQSTDIEHLFYMGAQPMSLVAMQDDPQQSMALERFLIGLKICNHCTHVHNLEFDPRHVVYTDQGCRMYNSGSGWQDHLDDVRNMLTPLAPGLDQIIEVGAGNCEFLASLEMDVDKVAVDPCEAVEKAADYGIHFERELFDPEEHIPGDSRSTLVIMRHLLEHMEQPRDLLEPLASRLRSRTEMSWIYIEVPCCENAIKQCRIEDWTYEHPQHFTVDSMKALLHSCNLDHFMILPKYGGEVLSVLIQVDISNQRPDVDVSQAIADYRECALNIHREGDWIIHHLDTIVFWGGAGKSAMFLRRLQVPDTATVVDSHYEKVGMYVPGTGIQIQSPSVIRDLKPDYIVVTTSWRANDIAEEIARTGIPCKSLLMFKGGELMEVPLGS